MVGKQQILIEKKLLAVLSLFSNTYITAKIIWFLVLHLTMDVIYDVCYIDSPTGYYPTPFDAITVEGHCPNIAITFGTEELEWWSLMQVVNVQSVMICLAVSIQYMCVTDGQTEIL